MEKFTIKLCIMMLVQYFIYDCSNNFRLMPMLADAGFPKSILLKNIIPLTSTLYLGSRLEIFYYTLGLSYINGRNPHC
jgi:hypothetical protein